MVAAMGVAGVPEAGFISLALVLNTIGLPLELLPLLLTVTSASACTATVRSMRGERHVESHWLMGTPIRWGPRPGRKHARNAELRRGAVAALAGVEGGVRCNPSACRAV